MAFTVGKRCSLCGGKLNGKKVCVECGLDNTKNDSQYEGMISRNSCESEPLTHVHTHATDAQSERESLRQKDEMQQDLRDLKFRLQQKYGSAGTGARTSAGSTGTGRTSARNTSTSYNYGNTYNASTYSTRTSGNTRGAGRKGSRLKMRVGMLIWLIGFVFAIISVITGVIESYEEENISWGITQERLDSADYDYSTELSGGYYTVGVHLPEGIYDVQLLWGSYASVEIYTYEEGSVYTEEFWFFDEEEEAMTREIELTVGMVLRVSGEGAIECLSNDVFDSELYGVANSLTDSYSVQKQAVAGVDFPEGTYDICYLPSFAKAEEDENETGEYEVYETYEYGNIDYEIRNGENQSTLIQESIYIDGENGEMRYYNVPFMKGSVIKVEGVKEIILVPSEVIPPTSSEDAGESTI